MLLCKHHIPTTVGCEPFWKDFPMKTPVIQTLSSEQLLEIEKNVKAFNGDFDLYACKLLYTKLGQSFDDAVQFAQHFFLDPDKDYPSMDVQLLTVTLGEKKATVDEIIEIGNLIQDPEKSDLDGDWYAHLGAYLHDRNCGMSHEEVAFQMGLPIDR